MARSNAFLAMLGASQRQQTMGRLPSAKGTFQYPYIPTNRGDAGAGVTDYAFQYPWLYPATWFVGAGNYNLSALAIAQGNPSYYQLSVTNAPAQGPGNISGAMQQEALLNNFYNASGNTAYF